MPIRWYLKDEFTGRFFGDTRSVTPLRNYEVTNTNWRGFRTKTAAENYRDEHKSVCEDFVIIKFGDTKVVTVEDGKATDSAGIPISRDDLVMYCKDKEVTFHTVTDIEMLSTKRYKLTVTPGESFMRIYPDSKSSCVLVVNKDIEKTYTAFKDSYGQLGN